jgi:hypothetical protein
MVGSVVLHLGLLILAVGSAGGALVTGGAGGAPEESAITISLAGLAGSRQASATPEQERLKILYAKALQQQSDVYASQEKPADKGSLAKLFDAIESAHGGSADKDGANGQGDAGRHNGGGMKGTTAETDQPSESKARAVGAGTASSSGGLWGQIEPCWKQMPSKSLVPVTLQIELDDRGQIARPPQIVRPNTTAPDQRRLVAEARALAAISACLPYRMETLTGNQRDFTVSFAPSAKP